MNTTSIRLLKSLVNGPRESRTLLAMLGIKKRRLAYILKELRDLDYVEKGNDLIKLKETPKTILFRDVAQIMDVEKLLCNSNEIILLDVTEPVTLDRLIKKSGLSKNTVYHSISDLQSVGAIAKDSGMIQLDTSKKQLVLFVNLLKVEATQKYENNGAEIIYNDHRCILRKVPAGRIAPGQTTAFSLFSDYGVKYHTTHDYFCQQKDRLDIQDVLIHAIYVATHSNDKMGLLMGIVFYLKHKDRMDVLQLRKESSEFGISGIWLDVEAYVRNSQLKNPNLFLPWNEFVPKARMYDVSPASYVLPRPDDSMFNDLNRGLEAPVTVYLFGGENMRIKKLKSSTKDCDLAVADKKIFDAVANTLTSKLGYLRTAKTEHTREDVRTSPSEIFIHGTKSRIDLFAGTIMRDLFLSTAMQEMADMKDYGMLKVGMLRNEHVFLLKAAACREGDIQDMESLVRGSPDGPEELQHGPFDWNLVWDEIQRQEQINHTRDFTTPIYEQITHLARQTGIVAPFLVKLRRHVLDRLICIVLGSGSLPIQRIVELLTGGEITESLIRNRVDALAKSGLVKKHSHGITTHLTLLKSNKLPSAKSLD